ncbi:uncharacterized protein LOC134851978 [Symsagittifera roscoffensis]|uniref:uncharacterized protein LOC134851978 n=1 Tax=Symsagittifera roscoffensis TaxID=84072 RepID=UPI00307BE541
MMRGEKLIVDGVERGRRANTLVDSLSSGTLASSSGLDYLQFQRAVTLHGFPVKQSRTGRRNIVIQSEKKKQKDLVAKSGWELRQEVDSLKRRMELMEKIDRTNNPHIRANLMHMLNNQSATNNWDGSGGLDGATRDSRKESEWRERERGDRRKRIDYQKIAREEREEAAKRHRAKKMRKMWRDSINKVIEERKERRDRITNMFEEATKRLTTQRYSRKNDQTRDSYAILRSEMERVLQANSLFCYFCYISSDQKRTIRL